jgi:hypothetical protein
MSPLVKAYTWADLASAVEKAMFDEGHAGMMCDVNKVKLSADRMTLEVGYTSDDYQRDNFQQGEGD